MNDYLAMYWYIVMHSYLVTKGLMNYYLVMYCFLVM